MATLIDAVKNAGKQAFCTLQSAGYNAWYLFSKLAEGDMQAAGKFATASNGLFCNNPVDVPFGQLPSGPFTGGQCPTGYLGEAAFNYPNGTRGYLLQKGGLVGPIKGIVPVGTGVDGLGRTYTNWNFDTATGLVEPNGSGWVYDENLGQGIPKATLVSQTYTRMDGEPDNCGDIGGAVPPYEPGSTTIVTDITYTPEGGGPNITIPATVILGFAYVDANANIRIPVTVNLGGVKIPLSLNLTTGDINFGGIRVGSPDIDVKFDIRLGGPGGITVPPGSEPPIGPPPGEPDYPELEEQPEPDTEPIIVGAVVTTNNIIGRRDLLYQDGGNPNIEIPRLGFINFLNYVPGLGLAWSEDIPIKNLRHLVQNPWPYGAIAVEGSPRNGVSWTITPVYKQSQIPIEYPDLVEV